MRTGKSSIGSCFLVILLAGPGIGARSQSMERSHRVVAEEVDVLFDQVYHLKTTYPDSAFSLINKILDTSRAANYEKGYIEGLTLLAFHFYNVNKSDTAASLLDQCLTYYDSHPLHQTTPRHGVVWLFKGYLSTKEKSWNLARRYAHHALAIFQENAHSQYLASTYVLLGGIDGNLGRYADALSNYLNAYKTKISAGEPEASCVAELASIALVHSRMGQPDAALLYGHKALRFAVENQDFRRELNILNSIGHIHSQSGNHDSAFHYYDRMKHLALTRDQTNMAYIAEQNAANALYRNEDFAQSHQLATALANDPRAPRTVHIHATLLVGRNYLRLGEHKKCIRVLRAVWDEVLQTGDPAVAIEFSDILNRAYEGESRYDSALYFLTVHYQQYDSVYSQTNQSKFNALYGEMETMRKETRIAGLKHQQQLALVRNQSLRIQLIGGCVAVTLGIIVIVLWLKRIAVKQKLLEWRLREELEQKKNRLNRQTLRMIYIKNKLEDVKTKVTRLANQGAGEPLRFAQQVLNDVVAAGSLEREWALFDECFASVHTDFAHRITSNLGDISDTQRRLAALIKMNLTNSEIASLLNIEAKSVAMAKYRLKKKLKLPEQEDVEVFLQGLR